MSESQNVVTILTAVEHELKNMLSPVNEPDPLSFVARLIEAIDEKLQYRHSEVSKLLLMAVALDRAIQIETVKTPRGAALAEYRNIIKVRIFANLGSE